MNNSWTWTAERGLTVREKGRGGKREKNWDNCNRIKNKVEKVN